MNKKIIGILSLLLAVACFVCTVPLTASAKTALGTVDNPHLISSVDDLIGLRDAVNAGKTMEGVYYLQTADLDLGADERTKKWEPIGTAEGGKENFFFGVYNGGGHVIRNLNTETTFAGLFSFLGGTVMNLGIESGRIEGDYAGAIASHATGGFSKIINCYSLATVSGIRAGGLADNFLGGTIVDSFAVPTLEGSEMVGGLVSYGVTSVTNSCSVGDYELIGSDAFTMVMEKTEAVSERDADIGKLKERFSQRSGTNLTPIEQIAYLTVGDGTYKHPYEITSQEQLSRVAFLVNIGNGHNFFQNWLLQKNDIDLSSVGSWQPIGTMLYPFYGVYNGGGYQISGLNVQGKADEHVGLFGYIKGTVMNLGIGSGTIQGDYAAGLVGKSIGASMIVNCYNNATIEGTKSAAGIANTFENSLIVNCLNTGRIHSDEQAGQICAGAVSQMKNCYFVGESVSSVETEGGTPAFCRQVASAEEAVAPLNEGLYDAASVSGCQGNDLVKWSDDGHLTQTVHRYRTRFLLQEIGIALVLFLLFFVLYVAYRTAARTSSLELSQCKNTLRMEKERLFSTRDVKIQSLVTFTFFFAWVMVLVGLINQDSSFVLAFTWNDQDDALMDFFNPLHTVLNGHYSQVGYYTDIKSTYPPIIKGILWLFSQMLPKEVQLLSAKAIRSTTAGLLTAVIPFMLCYFILYEVFKALSNQKSKLLPLFALFSSPMIFLLDRGNVLIFTLVFSALFLAGYRSENPLIRHLSYVCLALAASIKIYPAVLGLLVIREKKWKDTLWCVFYGALFCIGPFFVIGLDELLLYIRNVTASFGVGSADGRYWLVDYTHVLISLCDSLGSEQAGVILTKFTLYPVTLLLGACAVFSKQTWKAVLAVMLIQILFPGFSVYYCTAFLLFPLLLLIGSEKKRKVDYLYALLFLPALIPLQFLCGALGLTQEQIFSLGGLIGLILAVILIVDCAVETIRSFVKKKT